MTALKDIRIFDMTRILAGPFCTQILGDLGADVIKVEHPTIGDVTRSWGPPFEKDGAGKDTTESAYYLSYNRNKRSLSLDFTKAEGLEIAHTLIQNSDVFVENFKVGFLEHYGLGYEDVKKINPTIIYCSITGFGQVGPYAHRPGYDFQIQGLSGLMSLIGTEEEMPLRAGISIADLSTGMYSALAILAALYQRTQTGKGQLIEMNLLHSNLSLLSSAAQSYLMEGVNPPRVGNGHPNIVPYGAFKTQDGFVILAIGTEPQFEKFCHCVGREDLIAHPHFMSNEARVRHRGEVVAEINNIMGKHPKAYWLENLEHAGVPVGPVNTLSEAFQDPQVKAMEIVKTVEGVKTVASPLHLSDSPAVYEKRPPRLGEQTREILSEFLSEKEIEELKRTHIIL